MEDEYDFFNENAIVSVMPDYGGAYLWGKSAESGGVGGNIADSFCGYCSYLPISEHLQAQFHAWQVQFEQSYFDDEKDEQGKRIVRNGHDEVVEWDWAAFHTEGLRLAKCLKQELGNRCKVYYVKPYEDFDASERAVEVLLDGTMCVLTP